MPEFYVERKSWVELVEFDILEAESPERALELAKSSRNFEALDRCADIRVESYAVHADPVGPALIIEQQEGIMNTYHFSDHRRPCENAGQVELYLVEAFARTREEASKAVQEHRDILDRAIFMRSCVWYAGDRIADAKDWSPCPVYEKAEDDWEDERLSDDDEEAE